MGHGMTTAYPDNMAVTDWQPPPLTDRRTALLRLAASRYDLPGCTVMAALTRLTPGLADRPSWPARWARRLLRRPDLAAGRRRDWFDHFAALADRLHDLDRVGSTDDARAVLEEMGEGPWSEPWAEALTRRDELSAEIDRLVGEAQ